MNMSFSCPGDPTEFGGAGLTALFGLFEPESVWVDNPAGSEGRENLTHFAEVLGCIFNPGPQRFGFGVVTRAEVQSGKVLRNAYGARDPGYWSREPRFAMEGKVLLPCSFDKRNFAKRRVFVTSEHKDPGVTDTSGGKFGQLAPRLRKRGAVTRRLENLAKALPCWWSDLAGSGGAKSTLLWLESYLKDSGVKVAANRQLQTVDVEGNVSTLTLAQVAFSSEEGNRWLWVCPELLASLVVVRLFRPVSETLLASLRAKSRMWAREMNMRVEDLASVLPGTLSLAVLPMPDEVVAVGALRGHAGRWSNEVLGNLSRGRLAAVSRIGSWWDVLRPALRFGGTSGSTLSGAGCAPLVLPH